MCKNFLSPPHLLPGALPAARVAEGRRGDRGGSARGSSLWGGGRGGLPQPQEEEAAAAVGEVPPPPEMGFEGQRRGGTRGGRADFDWEDVRADKHR